MSGNVRKCNKRARAKSSSVATFKTTNENQHLLTIFPEEIWSLVFRHVKTVPTYQKITSASKLFWKIFKPHRVNMLLSDVIKTLINGKFGLKRSDILVLRGVCHSWKNVLDTKVLSSEGLSMEYVETFDQYDFPFYEDEDELEQNYEADFRKDNVFQKFEKHFDPTHLISGASPFLLQEIIVKMPDDCQRLYFEAFLGMLNKYGNHVWKCTLEFAADYCYPDGAYEDLGNVLNLMPNLKYFKIASDLSCLENKRDMKAIKRAYQSLVLPNAENLETVCLEFVPECVIKKLLQSNAQIQSLTVFGTVGKDHLQSCFESLTNLKEIAVEINNKNELRVFKNCEVNCSPTKLRLNINDIAVYEEHVFRALETQVGNSITELHLGLTDCKNLGYSRGLKLPRLETLTVEMDYPASIDFILPLKKSLKRLKIEIEEDMSDDDDFREAKKREAKINMIKIYKYWNKLHKSNVWEKLPELERLEAKCEDYDGDGTYVCTRGKWRTYTKKTRSPSPYEWSSDSNEGCPSYLDCD